MKWSIFLMVQQTLSDRVCSSILSCPISISCDLILNYLELDFTGQRTCQDVQTIFDSSFIFPICLSVCPTRQKQSNSLLLTNIFSVCNFPPTMFFSCNKAQGSSVVAHWLLLTEICGSNPRGGKKFPSSFFSCNLVIVIYL